jgi:hypothetical protein
MVITLLKYMIIHLWYIPELERERVREELVMWCELKQEGTFLEI